jgi:hypothetical protein
MEPAFGDEVGREAQAAGDRSAPRRLRDFLRQPGREGLGLGAVRDEGPGHDDALGLHAGPFDIGYGDATIGAVGYGVDDPLVRHRGGIALALDLQFVRRHRKGDIDGEDKLDIDGVLVGRAFGGRSSSGG